jgi:hypothetical protein
MTSVMDGADEGAEHLGALFISENPILRMNQMGAGEWVQGRW